MATSVLVVDDHELFRAGLAAVIGLEPDLEVVGAVTTVADALAGAVELRPAVIVADLHLPDGTALDIVRSVRRADDRTGVVVLAALSSDEQILAAMEAGASGFVDKDARAQVVLAAVRHAGVSPRSFVSNGLAAAVLRRSGIGPARLSDREHAVLLLLAQGLGTAAIAERLFVSESTAKAHIGHIYQKLGAANRAQALVTAMRIGMLSSTGPAYTSGSR